MKRIHIDFNPHPPWLLLAASALLAVTACGPRREPGPRPTPPPTFTSFAGTSRADLLAYAHSLQFDTSGLAVDAQYLGVPNSHHLVIGPYAVLAPEIGSAAVPGNWTREGRVFGRLSLDSALPEAGLPAGNTYIWVDSAAAGLRAMLVPENDSFPVIPGSVTTRELCLSGTGSCLTATARFEVQRVHTDSLPWIGCVPCDCRICCSFLMMHDKAPEVMRLPEVPGVVRPLVRTPGLGKRTP